METVKTTEQKDARRHGCDLDNRYGEIGISAVAAAINFRSEERRPHQGRNLQRDSD